MTKHILELHSSSNCEAYTALAERSLQFRLQDDFSKTHASYSTCRKGINVTYTVGPLTLKVLCLYISSCSHSVVPLCYYSKKAIGWTSFKTHRLGHPLLSSTVYLIINTWDCCCWTISVTPLMQFASVYILQFYAWECGPHLYLLLASTLTFWTLSAKLFLPIGVP